eukprot:15463279-Alexandrium_andersonii.AAC.1
MPRNKSALAGDLNETDITETPVARNPKKASRTPTNTKYQNLNNHGLGVFGCAVERDSSRGQSTRNRKPSP